MRNLKEVKDYKNDDETKNKTYSLVVNHRGKEPGLIFNTLERVKYSENNDTTKNETYASSTSPHQPGPDSDNIILKGKIYDKNDDTLKNKTHSHRRSSQGGWCSLKTTETLLPPTNSKPKTTYDSMLLVGASRSNPLKNKKKVEIIKTRTEEERIPAEDN